MENCKSLERKKILIVTVNYFSSSLVSKLISQLLDQAQSISADVSIICSDNSCSADEALYLKSILAKKPQSFELYINEKNLGYGAAINTCLIGKKFDYLMCINPDVELRQNTVQELFTHAANHSSEGIWGGVTLDKREQPDHRHAWQEPTLLNTFAWAIGLNRLIKFSRLQDNYRHIPNQNTAPYPVDSVSGCCMLISFDAWQAIGHFDQDFFLYSEEVDLCHRARHIGFQPTVVPQSTLHHTNHSKNEFIKRVHIIYSAKFRYAKKHHGALYNGIYRTTIAIAAMVRSLGSLYTGHWNAVKVWARLAHTSFIYKS